MTPAQELDRVQDHQALYPIKGTDFSEWRVSIVAYDHTGRYKLGYRAWGTVKNNLTSIKFIQEVQVHDRDRHVWTEMPVWHRTDIRKQIVKIVRTMVCPKNLSISD